LPITSEWMHRYSSNCPASYVPEPADHRLIERRLDLSDPG
jgi:hypothetical protein